MLLRLSPWHQTRPRYRYLPPYAIHAGNPAKFIRYRFSPEIIDEFLKIGWWNWEEEKVNTLTPELLSRDIEAFVRAHRTDRK
ncbi:hypothetical protein A0U89_05430 [Kozakia baliensis]|uniref:Chloramphenicol acetyltransferase n=1 Tax=Kozakia baliensis TaxID=153496 RepID=A0A1D8UT30_9PROT|nr:hypothetical protein [Kozakia baliensis]AOX16657.1 hypothetical protein A0U89_05430 [Kozakia baliensis]